MLLTPAVVYASSSVVCFVVVETFGAFLTLLGAGRRRVPVPVSVALGQSPPALLLRNYKHALPVCL